MNPSPFYDSTRTFDPMTDTPIMHPPHPMMYRPMSLKAQEKKATTCSTWTHAVKYNGIDGEEVNIAMNDYINMVWKHVFEHGMGDDCAFHFNTVSYTHLTLPTICSV